MRQPEESSAENRRSPRVNLNCRAWCEGGNITLYLQMLNASLGGLFLRTVTPLPPGARTRVLFRLHDGTEVRAEAEVAWTTVGRGTDTPGMGLRLVKIDTGATEFEEFVNQAALGMMPLA